MFRLAERLSVRFGFLSQSAHAFSPLAGLPVRDGPFDPVFFISGMAVLSAGLVVLRASHDPAPAPLFARRTEANGEAVPKGRPARVKRYTADEALAERRLSGGERETLLTALAAAAETIEAMAGHLPREASDRAQSLAGDLKELVSLNRARRER